MDAMLLTGRAGMLGRAVVRQLWDKGQTVCVLVRRNGPLAGDPTIESVAGDLSR